jgi:hypothetical protein
MFCRVTNEGVILMNLFMIKGHISPMTYNYYCHWIRIIYDDYAPEPLCQCVVPARQSGALRAWVWLLLW